jgi:hypothetical protein
MDTDGSPSNFKSPAFLALAVRNANKKDPSSSPTTKRVNRISRSIAIACFTKLLFQLPLSHHQQHNMMKFNGLLLPLLLSSSTITTTFGFTTTTTATRHHHDSLAVLRLHATTLQQPPESTTAPERSSPGAGYVPEWENRSGLTRAEFLNSDPNKPDLSNGMWECPLTRWNYEKYVVI